MPSQPVPLAYANPRPQPFDAASVTRPDRRLMTYYVVTLLVTGPMFPLLILPMVIRYKTLRYRFDEEGVAMSWGWIFRKEVYLTYRRIQDIHVSRNLVHRWLGLSEVAVQTAAGSAAAEMKIEGIRDPEGVRDFLYARMRGVRGETPDGTSLAGTDDPSLAPPPGHPSADELLILLREIRDELRAASVRREAR